MSHLWNTALAGWALYWADYLTGHTVSWSLATGITHAWNHIAGQVNGIVSGTAANSNVAPILWSAAPLANAAAWGLGIYKWYKAWKRDWLLQWIQEWSLWYSVPAGVMAAAGMTSLAPWAVWAAATWLWIYWAKKAYGLGKTFMEKPGENLWHGATKPFKWWAGALKSLWRWRWWNN